MSTTQVAVRMEQELFERLDWLVVRCSFENRAEAIRAAIEQLAEQEREREIDEQIIDAYTRMPQTDEELASSSRADWSEPRRTRTGSDWE